MKRNLLLFAIIFLLTSALPCMSSKQKSFGFSTKSVKAAFGERKGCFVVTKCSSGKSWYFNKKECLEKLPPCSTFKIWNALIGLSNGKISSADEPFYKWDGITRQVPSWNKDLTLKEAFQASCVPAFQQLAREIGQKTMKT